MLARNVERFSKGEKSLNIGAVLISMAKLDSDDRQIQKKINWISSQIRETRIQLYRLNKELNDALKEQEKLRNKK
ncbi:MAG: hypothetical protein IIA81_06480 [Thaumarchaeota archaeon]|nr:hypothetical protein [Nitrososphaerota archaeon]